MTMMFENMKFRFRVRRKKNGEEIICFFYFTMADIIQGLHMPTPNYYDEYAVLSVDMFTGLFDATDKEIYSRDILSPDNTTESAILDIIIFKHGCFGYGVPYDFIPLGRNHHYFDLTDRNEDNTHRSKKLFVVGNTHENPELLKRVMNNG